MDDVEMLRIIYRIFNTRRIEDVLACMSDDVEWPNVLDGVVLHGKDAVRAYWQRQFATIDPHVEPLNIEHDNQGHFEVRVHQTVRDLEGKILVDTEVKHLYTIRDGLIVRMEVEE